MSEPRSITRRQALVGFGASGIGLAMASRASAAPTRDPGTVVGGFEEEPVSTSLHSENTMAATNVALADHPIKGLWLARVQLPSRPGVTVNVPTVFGSDGTVMMMFPVTENNGSRVQMKGMAIGAWEALDFQSVHFTVVQTVSDADGNYEGTITIDGYPKVQAGALSFEDNDEKSRLIVRDAFDIVANELSGSLASNIVANRMSAGHAGFVENVPPPVPSNRTQTNW
jgi:hypothetical protein